jgi:hypothetical protein
MFKPIILNDCMLKSKECLHQAEINATKTGNQQVIICSNCIIDKLIKESEV